MTITVLGSNGKLGTYLINRARLADLGWRCQARRADADMVWSGGFDTVPDGLFVQGGTVINMIGTTTSQEDILHGTNVRFVQNLLAKAAQSGVAHVVLASSAAVYGTTGAPFAEIALPNPATLYGISKVAMEHAALAFDAPNAPAITILRIGNVAGADALSHVARRHVTDGTPMPLHRFADGSASIRSYIGPDDFFRAVHALSTPHGGPPRTINVCHPQPVALNAMLTAYRSLVWPDLRWADMPVPAGIPKFVTLTTDRIRSFVEFNDYPDPATAFVRQTVEHLIL